MARSFAACAPLACLIPRKAPASKPKTPSKSTPGYATLPAMDELNQKLIKGKEHIAELGRTEPKAVATGNRLPPGQHEVKNWPVLDLGIQPDIPKEKWSLNIEGLVEKPVLLTWTDFLALPQVEKVNDFHCVTTWSRFDNHWKGVEFKTICDLVKPKPEVTHVLFAGSDGYTTNLP